MNVHISRKEQRRMDAEERQEAREQRGDAGQLIRLEHFGYGECREAKRLREKLSGGELQEIKVALERETGF